MPSSKKGKNKKAPPVPAADPLSSPAASRRNGAGRLPFLTTVFLSHHLHLPEMFLPRDRKGPKILKLMKSQKRVPRPSLLHRRVIYTAVSIFKKAEFCHSFVQSLRVTEPLTCSTLPFLRIGGPLLFV